MSGSPAPLPPVRLNASWAGSGFPLTEHLFETPRHATFYLACGAADAPLIVFAHGWPELSHSWRHQLPVFAALGFRAIAPDMRGYGRSTVHAKQSDYCLEEITADMLELLDGLGRRTAIWVGHDWGSPVVWAIASHHPDRCEGVASLCVPYLPNGVSMASYIDRSIYPADKYPAGQWDYVLFYQEHFDKARADFEANVDATVKLLFRKGNPEGQGQPAFTASVRANGGWFRGASAAPDMPRDPAVLSERDLHTYTEALTRNGFSGPDSWYMNNEANAAYGRKSVNGGRLELPVLFLHAEYDYTCRTVGGPLADPMRASCADLTEMIAKTGHWMAQENPVVVNKALAAWINAKLPDVWRG
ncbi:MAG: alpha/beta hydrolase [Steroidobacteraceae bacterium]